LARDQRLDDAEAGCPTIAANQDLALGVLTRPDGEGGTVFLSGEADGDCCARRDRSSRQYGREGDKGER